MRTRPPFKYRLSGHLCSITLLLIASASSLFCWPGEPGEKQLYIRRVSLDQRNVFDGSDSPLERAVGSVINTVHVLTDQDVIRRELLFKEGDTYDQRLLDESGQNLRSLGIVGEVAITADTLADNTVDVTVRTRDRWTLRPGISLRQEGNRGGINVSVRDDNFLGNAQKIRIGYNYLSGPGNPHGGEVGFMEPRLWGSRWSAAAQYGVSQLYRVGGISVEAPFQTHRAPWAARVSVDMCRVYLLQFQDGLAAQTGYIDQQNEVAWVASASQSDVSLQSSAAYVRTRSHTVGYLTSPSENVDLVIGSLSVFTRKRVPIGSADSPDRIEDVSLGYQAGAAFGRNLHFTKAGSEDYFLKLSGQSSMMLGGNFYASYQALATTYIGRTVFNETTISGVALHHWRLSANQSIIGRVAAVVESRCSPVNSLVLGASTGLRGYSNFAFLGQRLLLINFEHRLLSLMRIWFLRVGGVLFFDSGAIWNQEDDLHKQRFHSSVGVGLCLNVAGAIVRMDVAYNLDRQRVSLGFSANQIFRVFAPLEFTPPVPGQPLR